MFNAAILGCLSTAAAHELWLDAAPYHVAAGKAISADVRNGERFKGARQIFNPRSFARFEIASGDTNTPVEGRLGDRPAMSSRVLADGLHRLIYDARPKTVRYAEWEKFAAFAAHKDFPDIAERHRARGLPNEGFSEVYTRHVKALVAVGDGMGADAPAGLETEFVALANPYRLEAGGDPAQPVLPVRLLYQGKPRADAQIEVFAKAADGTVTITLTRTDSDGVARIPVVPDTTYLLDAVVLRVPDAERAAEFGGVWETLWAALTFRVPG